MFKLYCLGFGDNEDQWEYASEFPTWALANAKVQEIMADTGLSRAYFCIVDPDQEVCNAL